MFIYDLDGTLVDSDSAYLSTFLDMGFTKNEYISIKGHSDSTVCRMFGIKDVDKWTKTKEKTFEKFVHLVKCYPGVRNFLKQTQPYAIVTNGNYNAANKIIKQVGLDPILLIGDNTATKPKPAPDPYYKAMKILGVEPNETIIFEDSQAGLKSAIETKSFVCQHTAIENEPENLNDFETDNNLSHGHFKFFNWINLNLDNVFMAWVEYSLKRESGIDNLQIHNEKLKGGFVCNVFKVSVDTNSFVLKIEAKSDHSICKEAKELDLYKREGYFYSHIKKTMKVQNISPKCIWCGDIGQYSAILLENVSITGASVLTTINESILNNVVDTLIHIQSTPLDNVNLSRPNDKNFDNWKSILHNRFSHFAVKWKYIMGNEILNALDIVINNFEKIRIFLSCDRVFCHGDFKASNMFYNSITEKLHVLDWQYIMEANGVTDLCFFAVEGITNMSDIHYLRNTYLKKTHMNKDTFDVSWNYSLLFFPLYVAFWFGTMEKKDLIDVSFPKSFIRNYTKLLIEFNIVSFIHKTFFISNPNISYSYKENWEIPDMIDRLHLDICDGMYAYNTKLPRIESLLQSQKIDIHLMVYKNKIQFWINHIQKIYRHIRIDTIIIDVLDMNEQEYENIYAIIKKQNTKMGIQIKYDTPFLKIIESKPWLLKSDIILLLCVDPGFDGRTFCEESIQTLQEIRTVYNKDVHIDGGINVSTIKLFKNLRVDTIVSGSYLRNSGSHIELKYAIKNH